MTDWHYDINTPLTTRRQSVPHALSTHDHQEVMTEPTSTITLSSLTASIHNTFLHIFGAHDIDDD